MTYSELKGALEGSGLRCFEYAAPSGQTEYISLSPYMLDRRTGDDRTAMMWQRCQIDCYSQRADANDEGGVFEFILRSLDDLGLPFSVQDVGLDFDGATMRMIVQCDLI